MLVKLSWDAVNFQGNEGIQELQDILTNEMGILSSEIKTLPDCLSLEVPYDSEVAKALRARTPELQSRYPLIAIGLSKIVKAESSDLEHYELFAFYFDYGHQFLQKGSFEPDVACQTCLETSPGKLIADPVMLKTCPDDGPLIFRLPGQTYLLSDDLGRLLRDSVEGLPQITQADTSKLGSQRSFWVIKPTVSIGDLIGDVSYTKPCPACGIQMYAKNNNHVQTYQRALWNGAPWVVSSRSRGSALVRRDVAKILVANGQGMDTCWEPVELL